MLFIKKFSELLKFEISLVSVTCDRFQISVSSSSQSSRSNSSPHMTLEELRAINKYAESTKSLSYLPQVRPILNYYISQ